MAKKSKIARNEQRKVIVERYAERRAELKKTLVDPNATDEAREAARVGLQKLPRNASPARVRSRDVIDGRPRGVLTKFGISRVRFRDMAHRGELPGVALAAGAAFDFIAGTQRRAPRWMQRAGLEWLHRLCSEPRRLWRRYVVTNALFLAWTLRDLMRAKTSGGKQ